MSEEKNKDVAGDMAIDLPLVKLTPTDVYGALWVQAKNYGELYHDTLIKLQTWIINFAEEQIRPLRDSEEFTEEELESIKKKICVISPITLTLYMHWLQIEEFSKLKDSEKEKYLLEKMPDRFKARFKGNESCRNARELTADDEDKEEQKVSKTEETKMNNRMSFVEFVRNFCKGIANSK